MVATRTARQQLLPPCIGSPAATPNHRATGGRGLSGALHKNGLAAARRGSCPSRARSLKGQLFQQRGDVRGRAVVRLLDEVGHVRDLAGALANGRVDDARRHDAPRICVVNLGAGREEAMSKHDTRPPGTRTDKCSPPPPPPPPPPAPALALASARGTRTAVILVCLRPSFSTSSKLVYPMLIFARTHDLT